MPRKNLSPSDDIVMKSNAAARCRWEVKSVLEPRLVALLASKVMPDDDDFHIYEIPVVELIGKDADGRAYQDLASSIKKLMSKVLTIYEDNGWVMFNLFNMC